MYGVESPFDLDTAELLPVTAWGEAELSYWLDLILMYFAPCLLP